MDIHAIRRALAQPPAGVHRLPDVMNMPFLSVLENVLAFRRAKGRLPAAASHDQEERALGTWLEAQSSSEGSAGLTDSQRDRLREAFGTRPDDGTESD